MPPPPRAQSAPPPYTSRVTYARQFPLPFPLAPRYAPEEFLAGDCNAAARAWLAAPADWPALRLALHGESGTGKTHLLHWFAARHQATLLNGADLRGLPTPPAAPMLAIDDADRLPDQPALLHLLNASAERHIPVLLAARTPPASWPIAVPDLASRLRATTTAALLPLEDSLLRALLARLLAERQIAVAPRIQDYLHARLPRTGNALREAAACLDRLALAAAGPVTLDHARQVAESLAQEKGPGEPGPLSTDN